MSAVRLNPAQQDAVFSDEALLICACPGSGKTKVLVSKAQHILTSKPAARIILTTFSRDAASEITRRLSGQHQGESEIMKSAAMKRRLTIGTFHALALLQMKRTGWRPNILSGLETEVVVMRALHDANLQMSLRDAIAAIEVIKSRESDEDLQARELTLLNAYQKQMDKREAVDFIDILKRANEQMVLGMVEPLASDYLFADEYQDIDAIQFKWLMLHLQDHRIPIAVGDDDQSIYGFRRALGYRGMQDFVAATGARIITLDTNYRSTAGIVARAAELISHNIDRVQKTPVAARGNGLDPIVRATQSPQDQQAYLVATIFDLCKENPLPVRTEGREAMTVGVQHGQVAILARTNIQLMDIEKAMIAAGIPVYRMGRSLWDDPTVQVFVALLKSLHAGSSTGIEVALKWADRLKIEQGLPGLIKMTGGDLWNLVSPNGPHISKEQLPTPSVRLFHQMLSPLASNMHPLHGKANPAKIPLVISGVHAWMRIVITQNTDSALDLCKEKTILDANAQRLADSQLKKLKIIEEILQNKPGSISARFNSAQQTSERDIPRVMLGTWHAAKGLEWENVFLVDVNDGKVPIKPPETPEGEMFEMEQEAEERRIFFVAMTRARDRLYLCHKAGEQSDFLIQAGLAAPRYSKDRPHTLLAA